MSALARSRHRLWGWLAFGLFLAALVLIAHLGFFLYAAAVVGALVLLCWGWAATDARGLVARRRVTATEIELDESVDVKLEVGNQSRQNVGWLTWEDSIESGVLADGTRCGVARLDAGGTLREQWTARFPRRGLYRLGPTLVETSDPFGLTRRFQLLGGSDFVTVLPRGVPLTTRWPLGHRPIHEVPRRRSFVEDPTRFVGIREYRRGDELRKIHWRATARTGTLQTRLLEPAVLSGTLIALDVSEDSYPGLRKARARGTTADEDWLLEHAITTAVSLADFVLAEGQSVGLIANGADAAEAHGEAWTGRTFRRLEVALEQKARRRTITRHRPVEVEAGKGSRHLSVLRTALARLVPSRGLSLPELLFAELPRLPRSLVVVVITPALTPELSSSIAALQRSGIDVAVLWLAKAESARTLAIGMPAGVPVHCVPDEAALMRLGEQVL